jgi:hypothetical protein
MSQPADKPVKKSATNEWVETIVVVAEAGRPIRRAVLREPMAL